MKNQISKLKIIFEDENIIIVDKPIGMLSHPDEKLKEIDILSELKKVNSNAYHYAVINRLDFNTSGLVVVGKNLIAIKELNKASIDRKIQKTYLCGVTGYFFSPSETLVAYLLKDSTQSKVRISEVEVSNSQKIMTKYTVLQEINNMSLLEVELLTGKTHQIRAHLAHAGHPLLGDPLYGFPSVNLKVGLKTQALCAYRLHFHSIDESSLLHYLNNKDFKTETIPFIHLFPNFKK
jgi:23S rRNA pseudouridine955/2504/2580 synthase